MLAGFSGTAILGEMHAFRARDPRTDDIGEGMSPLQVRTHVLPPIFCMSLDSAEYNTSETDFISKYNTRM